MQLPQHRNIKTGNGSFNLSHSIVAIQVAIVCRTYHRIYGQQVFMLQKGDTIVSSFCSV